MRVPERTTLCQHPSPLCVPRPSSPFRPHSPYSPYKPSVGIDTRPVRTPTELISALDDKRPGDRVRCDVLRDGKRLSMVVQLAERTPGAVEE